MSISPAFGVSPNVIVQTENSIYEINEADHQIRRVTGFNNPTPRQGRDGEWKPYEDIRYLNDGLFIIWGYTESGICQGTLTSRVKEMRHDW